MNDDHLSSILHRIPRDSASEGFESELAEKLAGLPRRPTPRVRYAAVAAATTCVLAVTAMGIHRHEVRQNERRLELLRAERKALELDLRRLRAPTPEIDPYIHLGSSNGTDYVLELQPAPERDNSNLASFEY